MKTLNRKLMNLLSKSEDGQNYAWGGGGLGLIVVVIILIILLR
mgnify:CR=1 FL=1